MLILFPTSPSFWTRMILCLSFFACLTLLTAFGKIWIILTRCSSTTVLMTQSILSGLCKKLCGLNSTLQCTWGFFFDCFKQWKALPRNFARLHSRIFLFFFLIKQHSFLLLEHFILPQSLFRLRIFRLILSTSAAYEFILIPQVQDLILISG